MEKEKDENQYSCSDRNVAVENISTVTVTALGGSRYLARRGEKVNDTHTQKHQRQVTYSVNAPPMTGPIQTLIANVLVTMLMHNGWFFSLIVLVMITRDP